MDLRQYFRKLREVEAGITEEFPLVVSAGTSDGGKPGVVSEVPRAVAAKLIIDGRAALASAEEREAFVAKQNANREVAEKADLAKRIQVAILSDPNLVAAGKKTSGPSNNGK